MIEDALFPTNVLRASLGLWCCLSKHGCEREELAVLRLRGEEAAPKGEHHTIRDEVWSAALLVLLWSLKLPG